MKSLAFLFRRRFCCRYGCGCLIICLLAVGIYGSKFVLPKASYYWRCLLPSRPRGIILHHTATPDIVAGQRVDAAFLDRAHARRGFSYKDPRGRIYHIGYHYVILRDGTIQPGRPENAPGSHTHGYNDYLGICLVGNFSSSANPHGEHGATHPSPAQLAALNRLLKKLIRKYHFRPEDIRRHRDFAFTACPGDRFPFEAVKRRAFSAETQPSKDKIR